jgi:3-oxoacyl-[acyl-carrier-protein] synthase II
MITALGHSAEETWGGLVIGKRGIRPIQSFDARGFACKVAAQVSGLHPGNRSFQPKWARIADLHSYMLMKCSEDAFKEADLGFSSVASEDIGFFVGMGTVDYKLEDLLPAVLSSRMSPDILDMGMFFPNGYQEIYPLFTLSMLNNISLCLAAIELNICGENAVFSPHADSGAQAITEAIHTLVEDRAKVALAGGVSEKIGVMSLARGHLTEVLSSKDDQAPCRPFAVDRAGTVLGEGCAILCLELRTRADERGAKYTTAITGYGHAFGRDGGVHGSTTEAIVEAMSKSLDVAQLRPADIDVVIAHGDGSPVGDQNEMEAITRVFSASLDKILVYSSKAALGHLLAAAPALDAVLSMYVLNQRIVPPVLPRKPAADRLPFRIVGDAAHRSVARRVMVNCRSCEGQSASLVLENVAGMGS